MSQDRTQQRTMDVDAEWSPFSGPVHGTAAPDGTPDADAHPSTAAGVPSWRPRVIDGGRGHEDAPSRDETVDEDAAAAGDVPAGEGADVLDDAAADVLAILDTPDAVEPETSAAPEPVDAATQAPAAQEGYSRDEYPSPPAAAPAPAPQETPAPAQEANSTPHTPHPDQATPETPAPAQGPSEAAPAPHSTPWLRAAVGWLNPYEVLDQPLPPVSAIYTAAHATVSDRHGAERALTVAWTYGIGMPVTVACYTIAAAVQRWTRGIGVALTVLAWMLAADTAPVDASLIWWWTLLGYWVSTAFVLPAVIQAKK